ncbi:sporulation histidine kinase inhibitor Sda [Paenibacillus oralis]|uniref:Sporulation histidine kinase inhibitor Sda n=1 Tax=Paenibacillus oralis TaxID=2490856 RepID=A0A3P3TB58_9BACL|nr:sporulation histidine kinase inhibitor Sda [Paenibacillus oralis]RRJ54764.1 sporulation histidine kinase inhibitor Sda [Paenibacillus oralis]
MHLLSDEQLLESFGRAKQLGLDEHFLELLMEEVKRRKIDLKEEEEA